MDEAKKAANTESFTNIVQSFGLAWPGHPSTFRSLAGFALLLSAFGHPYLQSTCVHKQQSISPG